MNPYEILDSTSELRIRVFGVNYRELVKNALLGMFAAIEPRLIDHTQHAHTIYVTSPNREVLLVDFLQHALVLASTHKEAFSDVHIASVSDTEIQATVYGQKIKSVTVEIKAVTYHELKITERPNFLSCDITFDI